MNNKKGDEIVGVQLTVKGFDVVIYEWDDEPVNFHSEGERVITEGCWKVGQYMNMRFTKEEDAIAEAKALAARFNIRYSELR